MRIKLPNSPTGGTLNALRERIEQIESARAPSSGRQSIYTSTGWPEIDAVLPGSGLRRAGIHEWIGLDGGGSGGGGGVGGWTPALSILQHLALRSIDTDAHRTWLAWVGREVWPSGHALMRGDADQLERSLFIDARDVNARVWATDLLLRCGAFACVVADGSRLPTAMTRRLQLAGEQVDGIAFLARPPTDRGALSAASTRWCVARVPSESESQRWSVELLRCKGVQPDPGTQTSWILEREYETGRICVPAQPERRSDPQERAHPARHAAHRQSPRRSA